MALVHKKRKAGAVYGHSKGKAPGSKHFYRPVWSGGKWDEFAHSRASGSVLQVCCGASFEGDMRLDLDPESPSANIRADMFKLPFASDSFDTVSCDPPYGIAMPQRVHLQREIVRVARKLVLFKAPWIPRATGWALGETVLVGTHTCQNVAVLSVLERKPETGDLL